MFPGEETKVEPLAEFRPSFGFKLSFSIGGDDSAGIWVGAKCPHDKMGHRRRFGDSMARGNGFLNSFVEIDNSGFDPVH